MKEMFNELKTSFVDDTVYEILENLQDKLDNGIYYLEGIYLEDTVEGRVEKIDGIKKEDLGVERHLQPLYDIPSTSQQTYTGKVKIEVALIDSNGNRHKKYEYMEVDYESSDSNVDVGEYIQDFLDASYEYFVEET